MVVQYWCSVTRWETQALTESVGVLGSEGDSERGVAFTEDLREGYQRLKMVISNMEGWWTCRLKLSRWLSHCGW